MKGRTPTKAEREWMDAARELGCIVCLLQYGQTPPAAIHHLDGKTKPDAHFKTIGLCYNHHQGGESEGDFISIHPWKKRFQDAYGREDELLEQVKQRLGDRE